MRASWFRPWTSSLNIQPMSYKRRLRVQQANRTGAVNFTPEIRELLDQFTNQPPFNWSRAQLASLAVRLLFVLKDKLGWSTVQQLLDANGDLAVILFHEGGGPPEKGS